MPIQWLKGKSLSFKIAGLTIVGGLMSLSFWLSFGEFSGSERKSVKEDVKHIPAMFSASEPWALEITRTRSVYKAKKIWSRLSKMGFDPYVFKHADDGGDWYIILNHRDTSVTGIKSYRDSLQKVLPFPDLKIQKWDSTFERVSFDSLKVDEVQRIASHRPGVDPQLLGQLASFPSSDNFNLTQVNCFAPGRNSRHENISMPKGMSRSELNAKSSWVTQAVYTDNLFEDALYITEFQAKEGVAIDPLSLVKRMSKAHLADSAIHSFELGNLRGYKIAQDGTKNRRFFVLWDAQGRRLLLAGAQHKRDEELEALLASYSHGDGLFAFDELYNTFYTLPEQLVTGDVFIGFGMERLTNAYAASKGFAPWAKMYVGHWAFHGYFENATRGPWQYGIFDVLTASKQKRIETTYRKSVKYSDNVEEVAVYGVKGHYVQPRNLWFTQMGEYEINFPIGRYTAMVDAEDKGYDFLLPRANAFQFLPGGYIVNSQNQSSSSKKPNSDTVPGSRAGKKKTIWD